jgi:dihydroorotate dehydrogenase
MIWKFLIRPFLFLFDPEVAHHITLDGLKLFCKIPGVSWVIRALYAVPSGDQPIQVAGLKFKNPVGLAAGLDKNGNYIKELALFGFSHIEIGTVTPRPQPGNPKPRLFRLPKDHALINRMGFNNEGAEAMAARLEKLKKPNDLILGINIGKNKDTPLEQASADYLKCLEVLYPYADYFTINISSPNTPGLRGLQDKGPLIELLTKIRDTNNKLKAQPKPLFVKIAPDLDDVQLQEIKQIAIDLQMDGLIMGNTTLDRSGLKTDQDTLNKIGAGGLSGAPLEPKSLERLNHLIKLPGQIDLIGIGGIMDAPAAIDKLKAGADLIQIYTGFIYGGPGLVKRIVKSLSRG